MASLRVGMDFLETNSLRHETRLECGEAYKPKSEVLGHRRRRVDRTLPSRREELCCSSSYPPQRLPLRDSISILTWWMKQKNNNDKHFKNTMIINVPVEGW